MWGKSISLQQILTPEKRITGLADCHISPGKRGKVISFEINPFTVNILKHREKVAGGGGGRITRPRAQGYFRLRDCRTTQPAKDAGVVLAVVGVTGGGGWLRGRGGVGEGVEEL